MITYQNRFPVLVDCTYFSLLHINRLLIDYWSLSRQFGSAQAVRLGSIRTRLQNENKKQNISITAHVSPVYIASSIRTREHCITTTVYHYPQENMFKSWLRRLFKFINKGRELMPNQVNMSVRSNTDEVRQKIDSTNLNIASHLRSQN